MDAHGVSISKPKYFGLREVIIINAIGVFSVLIVFPILGLGLSCILYGGLAESILLVGVGLAFIGIDGLGMIFVPAMLGNPYVAHLVRSHLPVPGGGDPVFIVQMAMNPRLCTGIRGALEDADDMGYLVITDDAIKFFGDHTRLELLFQDITDITIHNVGFRGAWVCGKRIRIKSRGLHSHEGVEFADRTGWTLPTPSRRTRDMIVEIESKKARADAVSRMPPPLP